MKMDNLKIGCFIAECRKEKQITQQQLADKLNITNKAVSKWETGNGLPDITLLTELAEILDVSADEILKAKKNEKIISVVDDLNRSMSITTENVIKDKTDTVISYLVHKYIVKFKIMAIVSSILAVFGAIIQYFIWTETKDLTGWLFGCWLEICSGGIFYYFSTMMKNQIRDYNDTAKMKLNAKDISGPYLRFLRIIWVITPIMLLFYIIK